MSIARDIAAWLSSTTTKQGPIELATAAEVTTGTDSSRAVVSSDLKTELNKKIDDISGGTTGNLASIASGGQLSATSLKSSKVPQVDLNVEFEKDATFDAEVNNGIGGSWTTTWANGNKQARTMNANGTATFSAPSGPCNLVLRVTNSGAARTITWPAAVQWGGGTKPAASTGVDVYCFYYSGSTYYGGVLRDCS